MTDLNGQLQSDGELSGKEALGKMMYELGMEIPGQPKAAPEPAPEHIEAPPQPDAAAAPQPPTPPAPDSAKKPFWPFSRPGKKEPLPTPAISEAEVDKVIDEETQKAVDKQEHLLADEIYDCLEEAGIKIDDQIAAKVSDKVKQKLGDLPRRITELTDERNRANRSRKSYRNIAIAGVLTAALGAGVAFMGLDRAKENLQAPERPTPKTAPAKPGAKALPAKPEVSKAKPETKDSKKPEVRNLTGKRLEINRKTGADCAWNAIKLQIVPDIIKGTDWQQGVISKGVLLTDAIKDDWVDYCHKHGRNPNLVYNGDKISLAKFIQPHTQAEIDRINASGSLQNYLGSVERDQHQARQKTVQDQIESDAAAKGIKIQFPERPAQAYTLPSRPTAPQAYELNQQKAAETRPTESPAQAFELQPALAPTIQAPQAQEIAKPTITAPIAESNITAITAPTAQPIEQSISVPTAQPIEASVQAPLAQPKIEENTIYAPKAQPLEEGNFVKPVSITAPDAQYSGPDYSSFGDITKKKKRPNEW